MSKKYQTYDFKSVGIDTVEFESNIEFEELVMPIGIMTPIRLADKSDSVFEMHSDILLVARDNLRNLITTNHGERLMLTDYGANLRDILFDLGTSAGSDAEIMRRIQAATGKYMPHLELENFTPVRKVSTDGIINKLAARLIFSIPAINARNIGLEVILYEGA